MESRAKLLGHSVHQILIVFPLGLLATAVVFDLAYLWTDDGTQAVVAFWMMAAGIVGGLVAAPFGVVDWLAIPRRTRAKRIGLLHAGANVGALGLFAASWLLRWDVRETPDALPIALALAGAAMASVGGWLGGELVSRLGVGVYDGAHLDAPSSLSGRPAAERSFRR